MEYSKKFVAIDLETTHLDEREGRIMEVGAAEVELYWEGGKVKTKFGKTFSSLINPEIEPSETALMITGIKKEELQKAPKWNEIKRQFQDFIGTEPVIGHNIGFDLGYLRSQGLTFKNDTLDTLELARTLLPLETSHSLEALAEGFSVLEDVPHRALVDCQNTGKVAAGILNEFLQYPKQLQSEVKEILGRSSLNFIHMVSELPETNSEKTTAPHPLPQSLPTKGREEKFDFQLVDKTVYCFPLSFKNRRELLHDLANMPQKAMVGLSHKVFLSEVEMGQIMTNPALALCEERFARFLEENALSTEMAKILVKLMILRTLRKNLDLSNLKWAPDEVRFLHYLTVNPTLCQSHSCRYAKELAKSYNQPVFGDLETVFALARYWNLKGTENALVLFDLPAIEDRFTDSCMVTWNLKKIRNLFAPLYPIDPDQQSFLSELPSEVKTILNELDLFFGILHLVYLKREGDFAENLIVDDLERNHERFTKLFHPAEKLQRKLGEFAEYLKQEIKLKITEQRFESTALLNSVIEAKKFMGEFFSGSLDDNKITWLKFNSSWVDLNAQPVRLEREWKNFAAKFKSVTIIDAVQPQAVQNYFTNRLGLSDYSFQKSFDQTAPPVPIKIFSKGLTQAKQINVFSTLGNRTLLLLPNELTLAKIYQALCANPKPGIDILSYKFSGNVGVLKKKLSAIRGNKFLLLLTMHAVNKHWRILPELENLVIFKLPFEARGSKPTLLGLPENRAFTDHILPRAISQLHRTLVSFLSAEGASKQVFILDSRILTDYDQSFLKYFEEFPEFRISTD